MCRYSVSRAGSTPIRPAAFRAFAGVRQNAKSDRIRRSQKIIVGPWPHAISRSSRTGQIDFGPRAVLEPPENLAGHNVPAELSLKWFDYWLKDIDNGMAEEAPIRIFVMGANVWRDEFEWPLARTRFTKFHLHSNGRANSLDPGEGRLRPEPPQGAQPPDRYTYNPEDPVWERGGNFSYSIPGVGDASELAGPFDQRPTERRDDVLVYTSDELEAEVEATGPLTAQLYVASSAPDTDFASRLIDVHPDGRAMNFSEGFIRARYRDAKEIPQLMEPGRIYPLTIEMQPTSLVFKRGHRIRVHITSSDFPHYDRNPNTGKTFGQDAEMRVARQTVYHEALYPSHILLPIIPAAR